MNSIRYLLFVFGFTCPLAFTAEPLSPPRSAVRTALAKLTPSDQGTRRSPKRVRLSNWNGTTGQIETSTGIIKTKVLPRRLGAGAFGTVQEWEFEGEEGSTTSLAIKSTSSARFQSAQDKLVQNALPLGRGSYSGHPGARFLNRPTLILTCKENAIIGIGFPLCAHGNLTTYKKIKEDSGQLLSMDEIRRILHQVAQGLQAMHSPEINLIHHDIKPDNIFVDTLNSDGNVATISIGDHDTGSDPHEEGASKGGTGTAGYMPPEKLRLGLNDHAADLYSLGMVGLFLLDEHRTFNQNMEEFAIQYATGSNYIGKLFQPYKDVLEARLHNPEEEDLRDELAFIQTYLLPLIDPNPARRHEGFEKLLADLAEPAPL